ncbi:FAD-binding oxidoreductase [Burkholderia stabilis]|uniref:FAD-binding oxidoreductase n=1 Tax=Burkholderia stabilis TaxID=95485 RepID=UPI00159216FE|nr:FAD-binding oxidoreductase [Burkholderia stabilis]
MDFQGIRSGLLSAFGESVCDLDDGNVEAASCDGWHLHQGRAAALMKPRTVEEVSAIVKWCVERAIAIVPQGGNTGLAGGAIPDHSGHQVILSLSRLNKIREIDAIDYTATVEAGCVLAAVQDAVRAQDRIFPMTFGAEGSCQIGGVLSTNAGGSNTLRYGNARDLVLGLEVVLADGTIWNGLRRLRKDNTGYDLRHLFMGAEGTLGIITAAVLKIFPTSRSQQTVLAALPRLEDSTRLLAAAKARMGETISAFELMPRRFIQLMHEHVDGVPMPPSPDEPWFVLIEFESADTEEQLSEKSASFLEQALSDGLISDAAIAANLEQKKKFWHLRDGIAEAQLRNGAVIYTDVSIPVSAVPAFIADACERLQKLDPDIDINAFGHVGDGNVHFNMLQPKGWGKDKFMGRKKSYEALIFETVRGHGGSISAEHGIGAAKVDALLEHKAPAEMQLMAKIRSAIAGNVFNPNKVVPI